MSEPEAAFDHAYARAADARAAIALVVERVRSGEVELADAFAIGDDDPLVGRCFAVKVIEVVPGIGKVRARRTMADVGMAEDVWLANVAAVHRDQLVAALALPADDLKPV